MRFVAVAYFITAIALVATGSRLAHAQDPGSPLEPLQPLYVVDGDFRGKKGLPSQDISGIACLPSAGEPARRCLVVDDEGRRAQFATVEPGRVEPGHPVELIGKEASEATLGTPPASGGCPQGDGGFKDLDGEGVAWSAPFFYVTGSHGCGRNSGLFIPSSFILARFDIGASAERFGEKEQDVQTTWRLFEALRSKPTLAPYFRAGLDAEPNGLNIEGLAVVGGRLFAGLRAPSLNGNAYLVGVPVADLFAPGHGTPAVDPVPAFRDAVPLPLGEHVGIRDLSALPDGRLLVLAGPAQKQDVLYSLHVVDPAHPETLRKIAVLAPVPGDGEPAKAEAVVPLGNDRVLILFDGLKNGGPREYAVPLH